MTRILLALGFSWFALFTGNDTLCGIGAVLLYGAVIVVAFASEAKRDPQATFWAAFLGWTALPFILGGAAKLIKETINRRMRK